MKYILSRNTLEFKHGKLANIWGSEDESQGKYPIKGSGMRDGLFGDMLLSSWPSLVFKKNSEILKI